MLYTPHFQSPPPVASSAFSDLYHQPLDAMGDVFQGPYGLLDSEYDITAAAAASAGVHHLAVPSGSDAPDDSSSFEHKVKNKKKASSSSSCSSASADEDDDLRRGPWTVEEDLVLVNYITAHGEGRWNSLARSAGLRRTGKSCRLRWLNYLRPDVRRGNITPEEQLLILELHSRWGNRWSKIAQYLPGRTDNEIKNYWRTRVQKHAKQLQCDVNSQRFKDLMRHLWMPRLVERIQAAAATDAATGGGGNRSNSSNCVVSPYAGTVGLAPHTQNPPVNNQFDMAMQQYVAASSACPEDSFGGASSTTTGTSESMITANSHMQDQQQLQLSPPAPASSDFSYYVPAAAPGTADYSASAASNWCEDYLMHEVPQPVPQRHQPLFMGCPQPGADVPCSDAPGVGYFSNFSGGLPDPDQLSTPGAAATMAGNDLSAGMWKSVEDMLIEDIWWSSLPQQQQYPSF